MTRSSTRVTTENPSFEVIPALLSRASQADAALYYLARMIDSGEDPKFIARRMVIFASEDIGLAVPTALIGLPECGINYGNLPIPIHLRNAPHEKYSQESYLPDKIKNKKYLTN